MKRVVIVHGWGGGAEKDWIPWLKEELGKRGYEVIAPEMPDTDNPIIERWVEKLREAVGSPSDNTYFIGHSIGCQAILRYLERIDTPTGGALFVAGWFNLENMESKEEERIAKPWIETPIDIEQIKKVLPRSTLLISDNDPYGCFEENKSKFAEFVSDIAVVAHGDHFNKSIEPAVLEQFEKIVK